MVLKKIILSREIDLSDYERIIYAVLERKLTNVREHDFVKNRFLGVGKRHAIIGWMVSNDDLLIIFKEQTKLARFEPNLVSVSSLAFSLLKRGQGFKPCSRMESPLWPALYPLRTDPMQAGISLGCDTGLRVSITIRAHLESPRSSDKKKN